MSNIAIPRRSAPRAGIMRHARRLWRSLTGLSLVALLLLLTAPLAGCSINFGLGSTGSAGDTSGGDTTMAQPPPPPLPQPSVWRVDPPVLTPEQQPRQDEVDQYLATDYQAAGWTPAIQETIQTYSNTIVDCVTASAVPGSDAQPPQLGPDTMLPMGTVLSSTEVDKYPELACPEGTIAIPRPAFDAYVSGRSGATSVGDYLDNHVVPGAPQPIPGRLYAGLNTVDEIEAAAAWVAAYDGELLQDNTMSVLEMAVGCNDGAGGVEFIGIMLSRDRANQDTSFRVGGDVLKLQVEYYIDDPAAPQGYRGGPEGTARAAHVFKRPRFANGNFVERHYFPGIPVDPSSIGSPPLESYLAIVLDNTDNDSKNWKWWLLYNGTWLGYYEASLFKHMDKAACWVQWYGEVYSKDTTYGWTYTDMGSGLYGETGLGNAAYFRNPFYANPAGLHWPDSYLDSQPYSALCYSRTTLTSGASPWDRSFFVGGPGSDGIGCKY